MKRQINVSLEFYYFQLKAKQTLGFSRHLSLPTARCIPQAKEYDSVRDLDSTYLNQRSPAVKIKFLGTNATFLFLLQL